MATNDIEKDLAPNPLTDPPAANQPDGITPAKPATRARRVKPLVEGINAPASSEQTLAQPAGSTVVPPKITLTNSEKALISEVPPLQPAPQKIQASSLPAQPKQPAFVAPPKQPDAQKIFLPSSKKSKWRAVAWSILISLVAVSLVLGVLLWYNNRQGGTISDLKNLFLQQPRQQPAGQQVADSSQQPQTTPTSTQPAVTPPPATTTPPLAMPDQEIKVTATPTGYLNVRSQPATTGQLLTKVHPGDTYPYTETQAGWYHITLPDGSTGWVSGQYVEVYSPANQ